MGPGTAASPTSWSIRFAAPGAMHFRSTPFDIYMESYDHSIDAIVAIGMHAGAGNRTGFLAHTYSPHDIDYRVNGVPFNETMILAMGASRLKIPVIMVSGDDQLERELQRNLPWAKYAAVKHAVNIGKAEPLPREEASRRIETAAREALQSLASMKAMEFAGPYRFAAKFEEPSQAANAALWPGAELLGRSADGADSRQRFRGRLSHQPPAARPRRRGPRRGRRPGRDREAAERGGGAPGDDRLELRPLDQRRPAARAARAAHAILGRAVAVQRRPAGHGRR